MSAPVFPYLALRVTYSGCFVGEAEREGNPRTKKTLLSAIWEKGLLILEAH